MGSSSISLIVMYTLLWLLPFFRFIRCVFSLRKATYVTESGREFSLSEDREPILASKLKQHATFVEKYPSLNQLHYIELNHPELVSCYGFSCKIKPQVLVVSSGLESLSSSLYSWLLKRGVVLALSKSSWLLEAVMGLCEIGLILFVGHLGTYSFFIPFFLIFVMTRFVGMYYQYVCQLKADEAVVALSSLEELEDGLALLQAQLAKISQKEEVFDFKTKWTKKILSDRISKLVAAIGKENLRQRPEKVQKYYEFLEHLQQTEEAFIEAKKMKVLRWIDADED